MTNRIAGSVLPELSSDPVACTADLAEKFLEQLMAGRKLRDVCRDDGMPAVKTVRQWLSDENFAARYFRARQFGTVAKARQTAEIAHDALEAWLSGAEATPDGECIGRSLLRIEAQCWLLAKFLQRDLADLDPGYRRDIAAHDRELEELRTTGELWAEQSRRVSRKTQSIFSPASRTKRTTKGLPN